jgi:hypothetical protein
MKSLARTPIRISIGLVLLIVALSITQTRSIAGSGPERPAAATTGPSVLSQIIPTTTVPSNGDVNPYGVAFVPTGFPATGTIQAGDILVSNFNNQANFQGTGNTIVSRSPSGQSSLFFQGSGGLGLTTALGVLKKGFVLVGTLPTTDGTAATIKLGSLLILNNKGQLVATIADTQTLDSPWYLFIVDNGKKATVYVSNVVSGTVSRLELAITGTAVTVTSKTQIAAGYKTAPDAAALVVGPTGMALDSAADILYVASTGDNAIYSIADASKATQSSGVGALVYSDNTRLHGPLGLVLAPDGNLITSNGDAINADPNQPSEIVEFTTAGKFVSQFQLEAAEGGAFGIALESIGRGFAQFAAVDDIANSVDTWIVRTQ